MTPRTKLRYELLCAWSGVAFVVTYVACLGLVAGFLPPPSPNSGAQALAAYWAQNHDRIIAGTTAASFFGVLLLPWSAQLGVMMAKVEGEYPVLAIIQGMGGALTGWIMVSVPVSWVAASYRPLIDPGVLQTLTDSAWMTLCMTYAVTSIQFWAVGLVGLADTRPVPLFPRWLCYLTLFTGTIWIANDAIPYHKTGPFAWDGAITLYTLFTAWLATTLLLAVYMIQNVRLRMNAEMPAEAELSSARAAMP